MTTYGNHGDAEQSILDLLGDAADDFDVDAAFNELFDYDEATSTHRPTTTSVDEIMTILDRYDVTAQAAARDEVDAAAEQADADELRAELQASTKRNPKTAQWRDLTLTYDTTYAGGGLAKWPKNPAFAVTVGTPDGHREQVTADSWETFHRAVAAVREEWQTRVADERAAIESELARAGHALALAQQALDHATGDVAAAVRDAHAAGLTAYRIAQLADLTQPRVARMIRAGASAGDAVA